MTPKRLKVVDFLHPIDGDREAIVIKNNLNQSYNYSMFFDVLSLKGWWTFQPQTFQPWTLKPWTFQLWSYQQWTYEPSIFQPWISQPAG